MYFYGTMHTPLKSKDYLKHITSNTNIAYDLSSMLYGKPR